MPLPGDLPNPGIKPRLQVGSLPAEVPGKPINILRREKYIFTTLKKLKRGNRVMNILKLTDYWI